jgi:general secretion pathway protein G
MARRRSAPNEAGFTLVELLIVVVVLGILVAVVMFEVGTFRREAADQACATDRRQVEKAAQAYLAKLHTTPSESDPGVDPGLVADGFLRSYPAATAYKIDYDRGSGSEFTVRGVTVTSGEDDNTLFAGCN